MLGVNCPDEKVYPECLDRFSTPSHCRLFKTRDRCFML